MDMLINRLYRTRVQIGYEPQDQRQKNSGSGGGDAYAYAGSDSAELSPLSIVFYTTAKNPDGSFQDLSEKFTDSPFAQELDDYGAQFKTTTFLHPAAEKTYQNELLQDALNATRTVSDTLNLSPQEADALLRFGEIAKNAYLQANQGPSKHSVQQMIDVVA